MPFIYLLDKVYYNFLLTSEFKSDVEEIFKEYHNHGIERASQNVTNKMLDELVVYGSINDCKHQIKRFKNLGIDLPILQINPIKDNNGELNYKDFLEL